MKSGVFLFGFALLALTWTPSPVHAWGSSSNKDKVLLKEVTALTLEQGKMTTGRRSSPVQQVSFSLSPSLLPSHIVLILSCAVCVCVQLKCVGGSAGCSYGSQPRVVQCHNRGFDGYDVQWECKAELDSKYQFGKIQVSCEGYEYPDDPYILRGSCGLEYELDLTQHGEDGNSHHGNYHHDNGYQGYPHQQGRKSWSWVGLLGLAVAAFIFYQVIKGCFGGGHRQTATPGSSYSGSQTYSSPPPSGVGGGGGGTGLGGFWTGAATGGALGYLFGNRGGG
ncbi:Store-operated calcium entry-associated regulatory factor [Geodia barretti]|uniref:Store-operated calcium entry-associated regulatory factor n=1 Tax=Geodia barretti TaxID=519541 RepID=A0AA35SF95_GEOBA|nr:Store-operated calcium entry-associated regulatory factor [Geodia barretti]